MEYLIFDNEGESWDRYTLVYLDTAMQEPDYYQYEGFGFSAGFWKPDGFGQHGYVRGDETGSLAHLGREIGLDDLPTETSKQLIKKGLV